MGGFRVTSIEFYDQFTSQSVSGRMSVRVLGKRRLNERKKGSVSKVNTRK
jgi:hypothetical protein